MNFHAESPKLNVEVSSAMADMADQSLNIYHQARLRIWTQLDPSSSWIKLKRFNGRADNSVSWQSQSDSSEDAIIILTYLINSSAKAGIWRLTEERFGSTVCTPGSATKSARFKRDQAGSELVVVLACFERMHCGIQSSSCSWTLACVPGTKGSPLSLFLACSQILVLFSGQVES